MASAFRFKWLKRLTTRTIARDLIIGLVTVVTLVAGGFIGLNYLVLSRQNKSQFHRQTQEYISYLQGSLAAPIWNFDDETITQIAKSVLKNELIAGLRVSDYKKSPIFESAAQTNDGAALINRSFDIQYRDKLAGRVELTFSSRIIVERNRQLLVSSLLTLGVILIALISVTGLLLNVLLRDPMDNVLQAISRIAQGDYHLKADLPSQVEIAQIIQQFNGMAEQIQLREKALTETNRRFEAILDNSTAVFYLKDVQGRYLLINKRYEELFHVDRKAIIGSKDEDIFTHELADIFYQNDQQVLAADAPIEFEEMAPHDDGVHTYLSVKFPLKDAQGQIYAICGISTDITRRKVAEQEVRKLNQDLEYRVERRTMALNQSNEQLTEEMEERRRAEAALLNNEALLLATLESTIDGILVIQRNEVTHANQRFLQMWGFPKGAVNDLRIDAIRSHLKGQMDEPEAFIERANLLYHSQQDALEILHLKDGRVFERFSCPLIIENQNQGRVWCFRDISDKKTAEEAMARAKDAAEAANRAKSDFLASMSHEIRTPMNGVMGMSGLLLETKLDKEQRDYANTIQTSAESLLTIINDILDFSKIEAGKLDLEAVDFDLAAAVDEVTEMLVLGANQKNLTLGSRIHTDVPQYLNGDPGRLRQIIVNLASNAIKFTEKGHVAIDVVVDSETKERALLRFSITDTGIGIPADRRDRLFKSFTQVDASTTRKFGGTGLGLAISKKLAKLLGGQIGVDSVEGHGATFWFTAEFRKQAKPTARGAVSSANIDSHRLEVIQQRNIRVLIVEDNATNQKVARHMLNKFGCHTDVAGNGIEAIQAFKQIPYHFILMDIQMPVMDGLTAASKIRELEAAAGNGSDNAGQRTPIVALTANVMKGDREKCLAAGMDDFLAKPINPDEVRQKILQWVIGTPADSSRYVANTG